MSISENIRKYRGSMEQTELAEKLGVTTTTVSRWENGKNIPNGKMLKKLANVLNTNISNLTNEENEANFKELHERSLTEDKGMMIYKFNENETLKLPATAMFIPIFEKIISERLKIKN